MWAAVAGAVAIVFALAWPALIRSVDARRYSTALIALAAMLLSGAYSVTAALGSAAGGRANAAATETAMADARAKAQAAYDRAKAELDTLSAAKPVPEIQALLDATKAELAKLPAGRSVAELEALDRRNPGRDCGAENGTGRWICQRPGPYAGELARARQRERLTAKLSGLVEDAGRADQRLAEQRTAARTVLDRASAELGSIQPVRVANSDAKALTRYIAALGVEVSPDRLNDLLILLAVAMIEAGGGLSLAIGMTLSGRSGGTTAASPDTPATEVGHGRTVQPAIPDTAAEPARARRPPAPAVAPSQPLQPSVTAVRQVSTDIIACLHASGGTVRGVRALAVRLGRPRSTVSDDLHRLAAAGYVTLTRGPKGMQLALVARQN